ncbi:MAG: Fe-S-containing protein [Verrucomicrobiales bacterium]|nr:Fe-S-containing protein [Verrucomicrobiales bacterium]
MSYFFASIFEACLPAALLVGLNWLRRPAPTLRQLTLTLTGAFIAGVALARWFDHTSAAVLWWSSLSQCQLVLLFVLLQCAAARWLGLVLSGALTLGAAFVWGHDPNLKLLAASRVVNTELLLSVAAILAALALLVTLACQLRLLGKLLPRSRWWLLALLALLALLPLGGNLLLALMQQDLLELTPGRLKAAALLTNFPWLGSVGALTLVAVMAALAWWRKFRPLRQLARQESDAIERRQRLAALRNIRRLVVTTLLALLLAAGVAAYWYQVAARPLKGSVAQRLALDANGEIQLPYPVAVLTDGKLRCFDWVADDGKVVRFFVINRFAGTPSPTVVFDACMLCGDMGYAQHDGQVVCIACGVRLYPPSIGNPGGCNPIPLNGWRLDHDAIIIPRAALEEGARYFTTVEAREVTDIVSARRLKTSEAVRTYTYQDQVYFFASEDNYQAFRADPEHYIQNAKPCCRGL